MVEISSLDAYALQMGIEIRTFAHGINAAEFKKLYAKRRRASFGSATGSPAPDRALPTA